MKCTSQNELRSQRLKKKMKTITYSHTIVTFWVQEDIWRCISIIMHVMKYRAAEFKAFLLPVGFLFQAYGTAVYACCQFSTGVYPLLGRRRASPASLKPPAETSWRVRLRRRGHLQHDRQQAQGLFPGEMRVPLLRGSLYFHHHLETISLYSPREI